MSEFEGMLIGKRERIYSPNLEYAHVTCNILDTSRGYQTNEVKMFTTFCKGKKKVVHSLAPALTLALTLTLHNLANEPLQTAIMLHGLTYLIYSSRNGL